jgi:hypothetical protein
MKKRSVECVDCHQEHQLSKQKSLKVLRWEKTQSIMFQSAWGWFAIGGERWILAFPGTHGLIAHPISGSEWMQNPCSSRSTRVEYPTRKWRWENGQSLQFRIHMCWLPYLYVDVGYENTLSMSFQYTWLPGTGDAKRRSPWVSSSHNYL